MLDHLTKQMASNGAELYKTRPISVLSINACYSIRDGRCFMIKFEPH